MPTLRPLPSGIYCVLVVPGPHFYEGNFTDDQCGPFKEGHVLVPDENILTEWARLAMCSGNFRSHWNPLMSAAVKWRDVEDVHYYRCGTMSGPQSLPRFDLAYDPEDGVGDYDLLPHLIRRFEFHCKCIIVMCSNSLPRQLKLPVRQAALRKLSRCMAAATGEHRWAIDYLRDFVWPMAMLDSSSSQETEPWDGVWVDETTPTRPRRPLEPDSETEALDWTHTANV